MEPKIKFNLKTFLKYLVIEPWTERFIPNMQSIIWILIFLFFFLRKPVLLLISIILGLIIHGIKEYKSGKHTKWYRDRKFGEHREAIKKIRKERKNQKSDTNMPTYLHSKVFK